MEDRETARMRKYGESKTTRIMMVTEVKWPEPQYDILHHPAPRLRLIRNPTSHRKYADLLFWNVTRRIPVNTSMLRMLRSSIVSRKSS